MANVNWPLAPAETSSTTRSGRRRLRKVLPRSCRREIVVLRCAISKAHRRSSDLLSAALLQPPSTWRSAARISMISCMRQRIGTRPTLLPLRNLQRATYPRPRGTSPAQTAFSWAPLGSAATPKTTAMTRRSLTLGSSFWSAAAAE